MCNGLRFELATIETIPEQVKLFNDTFHMNATIDSWKRKHLYNPLGDMENLNVFAAYHNGNVVGINGFIPMSYEYDGLTINVVESCDTAVDPNYRGQGIFTSLIMTAEEYYKNKGYDAMVGFPNKNSYGGFIKMGWEDMHHTMKYFFPCNVKKVANNMLGKKLPGFLDPIADIWFWIHNQNGMNNYSVSESNTISCEELKEYIDEGVIHLLSDEDYLRWKLSSPHFVYEVNNPEKCVLRAVVSEYFTCENNIRANILALKRYTDDPRSIHKGLAVILSKLRKKYDIVSVWESGDKELDDNLLKAGFIKNFSEKEGSPFIIKPLTHKEDILRVLKSRKLWKPMFIEADYVLDHNIGIC